MLLPSNYRKKTTFSSWFHAWSHVHGVTKQTVSWHRVTHNSCITSSHRHCNRLNRSFTCYTYNTQNFVNAETNESKANKRDNHYNTGEFWKALTASVRNNDRLIWTFDFRPVREYASCIGGEVGSIWTCKWRVNKNMDGLPTMYWNTRNCPCQTGAEPLLPRETGIVSRCWDVAKCCPLVAKLLPICCRQRSSSGVWDLLYQGHGSPPQLPLSVAITGNSCLSALTCSTRSSVYSNT